MSSIIERLTEGVVNRDMKAEGHALLKKWERTGLLEGLTQERTKQSMSRLLENQAKELLRESSSMSTGDVEGFAAVAFPIVRRVFAGLIANDLVSVQPMSLPSGLIFFLDFTFSADLGWGDTPQVDRFGNIPPASIYGTDKVGSQITQGVNLFAADGGDLSGPRTVGANGYDYSSPTGAVACAAHNDTFRVAHQLTINSSISAEDAGWLNWDPDLLNIGSDAVPYTAIILDTNHVNYVNSQADFNNLGAFEINGALFSPGGSLTGSAVTPTQDADTFQLIRRLTSIEERTTGTYASTLTGQAKSVRYVVTALSYWASQVCALCCNRSFYFC